MNTTSCKKQLACLLTCLLAATTGGSGTFAGETPSVAADVAMVQPFIGETTLVVARLDTSRLTLQGLAGGFKLAASGSEEAFQAWMRDAAAGMEVLRAATGGQPVYVVVGIPLSKTEVPVFVLLKETPKVDRKQFVDRLNAIQGVTLSVREGVIVAVPRGTFLDRLRAANKVESGLQDSATVAAPDGKEDVVVLNLSRIVPSPRKGLADAFKAVEEYPIQVLFLPPDYVRRTMTELMPKLPRQLGGGPSDVLTEGLVWAALGLDLAQLRSRLVVQSTSEEAARKLAEQLPKMLRSAHETLPAFQQRVPSEMFTALVALVAPRAEGNRVMMRWEGNEQTGDNLRVFTFAASAIRDEMCRRLNADSFKQILLAMHNYHDVYKVFPPRDEDRGNKRLSWRVHLLPFLEEGKLYKEFRLEEPWDSPHNKTLMDRMPKVYQSRWVTVAPGHTTFQAPVGEDTVFGAEKATKISDISDGTSNTVVLVEVKPELAVAWTAPQDYSFDPKAPQRGLQTAADARFLAGLADGSVQPLRGDVTAELLLRLFRKSDGQVVDFRAYR